MQLQNFTTKTGTRHTKRSPAENDRRPERGPEALHYPESARGGEHLQMLPTFLGSPCREQPEPLPTVETCELVVARQIRSKLLYQHLANSRTSFTSHCAPRLYLKKVCRIERHIGLLDAGTWICPGGPCIHHPLFDVDDIILGIKTHE